MSNAVVYELDRIDGAGVAVLTLRNPPVNAASYALRVGLLQQIEAAQSDTAVDAIVITGDGRGFCGGADIREFEDTRKGAGKGARKGPSLVEVCDAIEASEKPVVAAIHGLALGGGLEIAIACHYRVAVRNARLALPEVNLGILPGAGGTQRLPRLAGPAVALDMITTGKHVSAEQGASLGIIDSLVTSADALVSEAIEFAAEVRSRPVSAKRTRNIRVISCPTTLFDFTRKKLRKSNRGFKAPQACVDAVEAATKLPFEEGMALERQLITELMAATEAKALQYLFFAEREATRVPGLNPKAALPIRKVGIIGAGTMGGGIAMCCADAGLPVTIVDIKEEYLDKCLTTIRNNYSRSVRRGKLTPSVVNARVALITLATSYSALSDADLVIEAVFENMSVKKKVFSELDAATPRHAILCSNTSTLDIDEIAASTSRPEQVVGTHFFSPANVMKLLENVRGAHSSDATLATAMALGKRLRKKTVLVGNCDGFVANRMMAYYGREALFMLEEGALPHEVDGVMYKFGMPMGPFAVGDLAGLDIGYNIRKGKGLTDPATRPRGLRYSDLADRLVGMGRCGQKTGAGWYLYEEGSRGGKIDPEIEQMVLATSAEKGIKRRKIGAQEIHDRCILPAINEGFKVLEEGIALRPSDIDICWAYGFGFPAYRGGVMFYADTLGLDVVLRGLRALAEKYPNEEYFCPSPLLVSCVDAGLSLADYWKSNNVRARL